MRPRATRRLLAAAAVILAGGAMGLAPASHVSATAVKACTNYTGVWFFSPPLTLSNVHGTASFFWSGNECATADTSGASGLSAPFGSETLSYDGSCLSAHVYNSGDSAVVAGSETVAFTEWHGSLAQGVHQLVGDPLINPVSIPCNMAVAISVGETITP